LLNAHANACAEAALKVCQLGAATHDVGIHDRAIVEAFPSAFLGMLIENPAALNARRGDRSDTFFCHLVETGGMESLVEHLLPGRRLAVPLASVINHDDRAALVCGLTALCVAVRRYTAVGDAEDGWIILPPPRATRRLGATCVRPECWRGARRFSVLWRGPAGCVMSQKDCSAYRRT
jgi:hypothetical protein